MTKLRTICVVVAFCFQTKIAHAQPSGFTSAAAAACAGLLQPADIQQSDSFQLHYGLSQYEKEHNSKSIGGSGNYFYVISGSFNYDTMHDRMSQLGVELDEAETHSYFAHYLPPNQSSDYLACVTRIEEKDDGGVGIAYVDSAGGAPHFLIKVRESSWSAPRRLVVVTNGVPMGTWQKTFDSRHADVSLSVTWPDTNRSLVVRVRMVDASTNQPIDTEDTYVLSPKIKMVRELHISPDAEVRHQNQAPACDCVGPAVTVRAADDEILDLKSLKAPEGEWLHKTWGDKDIPCATAQLEFDKNSDATYVSASAECVMGQADENPGYRAHFEITGYHIVPPKPDPNIAMIEKSY